MYIYTVKAFRNKENAYTLCKSAQECSNRLNKLDRYEKYDLEEGANPVDTRWNKHVDKHVYGVEELEVE